MELPHPCISPLVELGSGALLNQCMHACNACGASCPFSLQLPHHEVRRDLDVGSYLTLKYIEN
jgi:hypothetical protein